MTMKKDYDLLIIGGDAAGMGAASQARRMNQDISIGVFDKGTFVSYAACGMPYYIGDEIESHENLLAIDRNQYHDKRNIHIFTETEAIAVDFEKKRVSLRSPQGDYSATYRKLIIATGARALTPPLKGIDNDRIFLLRSLEHGIAIKKYIERTEPSSVVLVGGGFMGAALE